ncbi:hypothetical protein HAX54_046381, partial [Datura stramonium]|nr:hypothetical protein [Datura stramonium]
GMRATRYRGTAATRLLPRSEAQNTDINSGEVLSSSDDNANNRSIYDTTNDEPIHVSHHLDDVVPSNIDDSETVSVPQPPMDAQVAKKDYLSNGDVRESQSDNEHTESSNPNAAQPISPWPNALSIYNP